MSWVPGYRTAVPGASIPTPGDHQPQRLWVLVCALSAAAAVALSLSGIPQALWSPTPPSVALPQALPLLPTIPRQAPRDPTLSWPLRMVLGDPPAANGGGAAPPLVADAPVKVAAMSPGELKARLGTVVVLDVRTALEDVAMGHIPGAVRLSKDDILLQIGTGRWLKVGVGKERPIVVVCLSGHRSPPMAEWLVAHGYGEVYDLTGGLLAWKGAGYPVSREASTPPSWP